MEKGDILKYHPYFLFISFFSVIFAPQNLNLSVMASCTVENWTISDLANALRDMHKDQKRIAVPMFQRGKRWNQQQQRTFIDSLIKGFPVGTMLFHEEKDDQGKRTYILIDGLQRGNCIKKYMTNPTEFFYDSSISDGFCQNVLQLLNADEEENYHTVRRILTNFIKEQKTFNNLQYYEPARLIAEAFSSDYSIIGNLINPNRSLGPISSGDVKVFSCSPESKECLPLIYGSHKT